MYQIQGRSPTNISVFVSPWCHDAPSKSVRVSISAALDQILPSLGNRLVRARLVEDSRYRLLPRQSGRKGSVVEGKRKACAKQFLVAAQQCDERPEGLDEDGDDEKVDEDEYHGGATRS
ncbi:hypothetical protein HG530_010491 [Fusarium avenaceum]|nr:hypothetical protein HG530_010491 [Fusarium avenaceum]